MEYLKYLKIIFRIYQVDIPTHLHLHCLPLLSLSHPFTYLVCNIKIPNSEPFF